MYTGGFTANVICSRSRLKPKTAHAYHSDPCSKMDSHKEGYTILEAWYFLRSFERGALCQKHPNNRSGY